MHQRKRRFLSKLLRIHLFFIFLAIAFLQSLLLSRLFSDSRYHAGIEVRKIVGICIAFSGVRKGVVEGFYLTQDELLGWPAVEPVAVASEQTVYGCKELVGCTAVWPLDDEESAYLADFLLVVEEKGTSHPRRMDLCFVRQTVVKHRTTKRRRQNLVAFFPVSSFGKQQSPVNLMFVDHFLGGFEVGLRSKV
ncbi:TPR-like protein, partial [Aureobasidium melanogenum]